MNLKMFKKMLKKAYFWRRLGMVLMLVLMIIRPVISGGKSNLSELDLNIWFVVDATASMVANDAGGVRRFERVQEDIKEIIQNVPGARFGLIVQDYFSYTASPLTSDADAVVSATEYVKPKFHLDSQPTNLSDLLSYAKGVISDNFERYPERVNALIFMSDGEEYIGSGTEVPDYSNLLKYSSTLGYGSEKGVPVEQVGIIGESFRDKIEYTAINPDSYWMYFYTSENIETDSDYRIISKLDEANLKNVASSLKGDYYHRDSEKMPEEIIKSLKKISSVIHSETPDEINSRQETYWIFAIVFLALLLWEGEEILNRFLREKEEKNA